MPEPWEGIDTVAALAVAGGLQLRLENVPKLLRLHRIAAHAARRKSLGASKLSSSAFKRLVATDRFQGREVAFLEDPFEGVYVVEVPYRGGPRLALQGIATNCGLVAAELIWALLGSPENELPKGFRLRANALTRFLLDLSDQMCRRAGLRRGDTAPEESSRLVVPSAARCAEIASWVMFTEDELFGDRPQFVRDYLIELLVQDHGELPPMREDDPVDDQILIRPIIQTNAGFVVAAPAELVACLRHHLLLEAYRFDCVDAVVLATRDYAVARGRQLLKGFVAEELEPSHEGTNWVRLSAPFDEDKLLEVIVVVDDLAGYDPDSVFGQGLQFDELARIDDLVGQIEIPAGGVLRLYLHQGVGRDLMLGVPTADDAVTDLLLSLDDLETITNTPRTDAMTLWHFARALMRLQESTQVMSFSPIDTFALYRGHHDSFYLDDDGRPTHINIEVATGQPLRIEAYRNSDPRAVVLPKSGATVRAVKAHRLRSPIYHVVSPVDPGYFVDLGAREAWVYLDALHTDAQTAAIMIEAGEAVAYWLWQLNELVPAVLDDAADLGGRIQLRLRPAAAGLLHG